MSRLYRPNAVRMESYAKVCKIGSSLPRDTMPFHGSGFFTEPNPHLLVTASHVALELAHLRALTVNDHIARYKGRLFGMTGEKKSGVKVALSHGPIIDLRCLGVDVAGIWVSTEACPTISNVDRNPPFRPFALPINTSPIDPKASYFMPVVKNGKHYEARADVIQGEYRGEYEFRAKSWGGYSGSPLFDEEGKAVGVIYAHTVRSPGWNIPDLTSFTPFSVLKSLGLLKSFLDY